MKAAYILEPCNAIIAISMSIARQLYQTCFGDTTRSDLHQSMVLCTKQSIAQNWLSASLISYINTVYQKIHNNMKVQ